MKKIFALFFVALLGGCYNAPDHLKPMPWLFKQMPNDAPNNYKRGWKDGCESGLASMTNSFYRTFYTFKQDATLRRDPTYYTAWKDTYNFCRHYAYGTLRESGQRINLPNNLNQGQQTFMGAEGIFEQGPLQMLGPGGTTLMPLQKVGPIGGNGNFPLDLGGISNWDYSNEYMSLGNGGLNMNYGDDVPFFGSSDPR